MAGSMKFINKKPCLLFFICLIFIGGSSAANEWMDERSSALDIEINLPKTIFSLGEPIEGTITVMNTYAVTLSATFNIRLSRNGELVNELSTSIDHVPSGRTEFTFKGFGIPNFNSDDAALGSWQMSILQQDLDVSHARVISFQIVPSDKINKSSE